MRSTEEVRLALSPATLARLLAEKRVSADDFRCLDQDTKHRVRTMFLRNLRRELADHRPAWGTERCSGPVKRLR